MAQFRTIEDAFLAASRFGQQALGISDQIKQERADRFLRHIPAKAAVEIDDYLRDNKFNYTGDPNDPDALRAYREKYEADLQGFVEGLYRQQLGNYAAVPYIRQNVDRMKEQSLIQARNHALFEEDKWRHGQNEVNYTNEQNKIINSSFNNEAKLAMLMENFNYYADMQGWDPSIRAKNLSGIYNGLFNAALNVDISGMNTVSQAHSFLDSSLKEFETMFSKETGEELSKWISDMTEKIETAKSAAATAIYKQNLNQLDTWDNNYRRFAQDAVREGDYEKINEAIRTWKSGSRYRDFALDNPDMYSPNDSPKIAGMFPLIPGLMEDDESGSGSKRAIEVWLKNMMPSFIESALIGRFTEGGSPINMYDAKEAYLQMAHKELVEIFGYEGSLEEMRREYTVVEDFFDEALKIMSRRPEYSGLVDAVKSIRGYINNGLGDNKARFDELYAEQKEARILSAIERGWDILFTEYIPGMNVDDIVQKTQNFVNRLVLEDLGILQRDPQTGESNYIKSGTDTHYDAVVKAVYALGLEDIIWTGLQGQDDVQYHGVDKESVDKLVKQDMPDMLVRELRKLPGTENITLADIMPGQFTETERGPSGTRARDKEGIVEFALKNDPTTKFRFVAEKNSKGQIELAIEKKQGSGGWQVISNLQTVQQRAASERRESNERTERLLANQEATNREARTLAGITVGGRALPMPNGYEVNLSQTDFGYLDEVTNQIIKYGGIDAYIRFLTGYYGRQGLRLPTEVQQFINARGR